MRYADLVRENTDAQDAVLDLLVSLAGDDVNSIAIDVLVDELGSQGIDVDKKSLFDLLSTLAIVRNIENGVVYFTSDSDQSAGMDDGAPDPEQQDKQVDKLARQQVDKEIKT